MVNTLHGELTFEQFTFISILLSCLFKLSYQMADIYFDSCVKKVLVKKAVNLHVKAINSHAYSCYMGCNICKASIEWRPYFH